MVVWILTVCGLNNNNNEDILGIKLLCLADERQKSVMKGGGIFNNLTFKINSDNTRKKQNQLIASSQNTDDPLPKH